MITERETIHKNEVFMCTSVAMQFDKFYFGRNLDLEYDFGDGVVFMPRGYKINLRCSEQVNRHLAVFGMGIIMDGFPLFAEGANERGVCIASLNFKGNAHYTNSKTQGKINLAPFELIPYLLARCQTAEEAKEIFLKTNLMDIPFSDGMPNTPLHFHLADKCGSYTLEFTHNGARVYENPYGVLTNNPPFPYHAENAKMYMHLSNTQPKTERLFTCGVGAVGLPGDYTSPSRFVKAAWLARLQNGRHELSVFDVFSTLLSVAPPRCAVITPDGKEHFTRYTCCIDTDDMIYYYQKHGTLDIHNVSFDNELFDTDKVIAFN